MVSQAHELLSESDFQRLSDAVYRHCGINLHDGKRELVHARISKRLRLGGFPNATEYVRQVLSAGEGEEFTELIDSLSTNLTSFFREMGHFDYLMQSFLPELLRRKQSARSSRIRAWSAGCSTGEEPYSLAITLLDATGNDPSWDTKLLATDISTKVLQTARTGVYDRSRAASVPPLLRGSYLTPCSVNGRSVNEVAPAVRRLVTFAYLNLMEPWPFSGPFDFIFCRNVMIYFDKPTQQKLVNRFWDCLDRGGLLFTGHSESLTGISHRFRYVQPTIYARD
jgi:chemotaxis protein methyltransferase CheR